VGEVLDNVHQEFWQPPALMQTEVQPEVQRSAPAMAEACQRCSTEFLVGARFCHACGTPRAQVGAAEQPTRTTPLAKTTMDLFAKAAAKVRSSAAAIPWKKISLPSWFQYLHFHEIKSFIGLPMASLIAFFVGLGCVVGALGVGLVYKAQNFVDFQAIQMWRIEWLLAATASFVAGILLKKPPSKD
jgi:hypothetical protein